MKAGLIGIPALGGALAGPVLAVICDLLRALSSPLGRLEVRTVTEPEAQRPRRLFLWLADSQRTACPAVLAVVGLPVLVQAQMIHECAVLQGVVVDGQFRLEADSAPSQRTFDVGSNLAGDTRIAAVVREADRRWPAGWVLHTVYDDEGRPVDGIVREVGWSLTCVNPMFSVAVPPRPPAPAPFAPQAVEVTLGESGQSITLMTTEAGGRTLEGEAFASGGEVTAENGSTYTLTLEGSSWSAAYRMPEPLAVALGLSGQVVELVRLEDGSYELHGEAYQEGMVVTAENGNMYVLSMGADGSFMAVYQTPAALSWPLGSSGDAVEVVRLEDGTYALEDGTPITAETRLTAANGNVYRAEFSPEGEPIGLIQSPARGRPSAATVTVTNLTPGQVMGPTVVLVHSKDAAPVFTPGKRASSALAMLAEDDQRGGLLSAAASSPHVEQSQVLLGQGPNGAILPGASASLNVAIRPGFDRVTVLASLTSTNDGFVGASGIAVPESGVVDQFLPAWDAGTEANDEDCDHIPGPPCGKHSVGDRESEPIVTHSGVHGRGDLDPSSFDWNYPAARITVEMAGSE